MLQISVPINPEGWDEEKQEFVPPQEQILQLEHSLISLSKWESKWDKQFLSKTEKTTEETIDYIRCMTLTQNVKPEVYSNLSVENILQVNEYIENPMTATTFVENRDGKSSREIITAELIYYWMISLNIPVEFDNWHLNRLLTLIRVCNIKNQPPKKRSRREIMSQNASLNAARKQQLNTNG